MRKIIKEEKSRILREGPGVERAVGLYADTSAVNAVHTALNDLVTGAYHSASEDIGEANVRMQLADPFQAADREARDAAQQAFVNVVQDAARDMG